MEHGSGASKAGFSSTDAAMAELDMDHYDSDDAEPSGQVSIVLSQRLLSAAWHAPPLSHHRCLEEGPKMLQIHSGMLCAAYMQTSSCGKGCCLKQSE